jgi:hypothetical protein
MLHHGWGQSPPDLLHLGDNAAPGADRHAQPTHSAVAQVAPDTPTKNAHPDSPARRHPQSLQLISAARRLKGFFLLATGPPGRGCCRSTLITKFGRDGGCPTRTVSPFRRAVESDDAIRRMRPTCLSAGHSRPRICTRRSQAFGHGSSQRGRCDVYLILGKAGVPFERLYRRLEGCRAR